MTVAAGPISLAREYLRATLADVTAFRTWVGADTQALALARIHTTDLPPPETRNTYSREELEALRPYAIVHTSGYRTDFTAIGSHHEYIDSGTLILRLQENVPVEIAGNDPEISERWENTLGQIIDGLWGLAGSAAGYSRITAIRMPESYIRAHKTLHATQGDFVVVDLEVDWGNA